MAKKRKGLAAHGFTIPIVTVRMPAEHRAIIQPAPTKPTPIVLTTKPPRSRAKRVRLSRCGNGTSSLSARMMAMGLRKYNDYLATPHWLAVKQRWQDSKLFKGWRCHSVGCDSRDGLSLHHRTYERVGHEELSDLILVCRSCHRRIHQLERRGVDLAEATQRVTSL